MTAAAATGRDAATVTALVRDGVAQRLSGKPVDRIIGWRGFWTLDLGLNAATLSPRPDTETLVEAALAWLRANPPPHAPLLLDLGTGTGAILLALLSELPDATGLGIDIAEQAVEMAQLNAARHNLATRVRFQIGNWFEGLTYPFDLIVSNPPYIRRHEIAALAAEVRSHDPVIALDGGDDGLDAYRAIAVQARRFLSPGGAIVLEIGAGQAQDVTAIFSKDGFMAGPRRKDLGGHERALVFI
jgi:release factor glutamine methyltransferase